jgi:hypothetical protein
MLDARTPRTALDLLEDGASPDLRDARLFAWLLDPRGEHGLGYAMLVALGACMAEKGKKGLSRILATPKPPAFDTSVRLRAGQVEVVIVSLGHEMVGVWRTRARGYAGALEDYASRNTPAVGIGRTADAFPPETVASFPVLGWADIVRVLDAATPPADATDGAAHLVVAFRERLRLRLGGLAPAAATAPPPRQVTPPPTPRLPEPPPAPATERPAETVTPAPQPRQMTRSIPRPTGMIARPQVDPRVVAERLLNEVPGLRAQLPGPTPPMKPQRLPAEGSLMLSGDRKRRYLIHRKVGEGREGQTCEVALTGGAPFPGFEEDPETAVIKVAHEGSDVLAREQAVYARPHPGLVRLLAAEPGPPRFLLLERLVAHPAKMFGRVDPVTAIHTFVNLLEAVHGIHDALGVVLCSIEPGNVMLRMAGDVGDSQYLTRLGAGAWEPVLIDCGAALGDAQLGEGGRPPLVAGNPLYLPPEAMPRFGAPGRYSRKTDIYALTLTFYVHLTGDTPYGRTDLHGREGADYLAELIGLKEKGTSPVNGLLLHDCFEADVAEDLLELLRAGLANDPAQRLTAPALLGLCAKKLQLAERRKPIAPDQYVYDAGAGLHLEQRRLARPDVRAVYGPR